MILWGSGRKCVWLPSKCEHISPLGCNTDYCELKIRCVSVFFILHLERVNLCECDKYKKDSLNFIHFIENKQYDWWKNSHVIISSKLLTTINFPRRKISFITHFHDWRIVRIVNTLNDEFSIAVSVALVCFVY